MAEGANAAGGQDVGPLREEIRQLRAQLAEATEMAGQNTSKLREELETLREELERERSRNILRRLVDAAQGANTLKAEIEELRTQLTEASEAVERERANLQGSIGQLQAELEEERSRGFVRRLFGLRPQPSQNPEDTREKMRGRLGVTLVWTLIAVVVGTYAYLLIGNLSPNALNTVVPMVGATLLTPLVGLIGAVMGFYYGGQTAVQAASQTAEATKTAAQAATAVQSATAAQMIAQTTAQKATTPQSAAVAQKTATQMATHMANGTTPNGTPSNGTQSSSTVDRQT